MSRLFISAAHKSSGKTTLTAGLAASFAYAGLDTHVFKKGPDYIDPLWLAHASGNHVYNLDFNTQAHDEIRGTFSARQSSRSGINLIEGNKGLHDGVATDGSDSSAALARLLKAPVVLIVDTEGMTRGIAPLLIGYANFDPEVTIAGVVLNRVATPRQESKLRAAVEAYTDMPVLGALPRLPQMIVRERHLGLTTPGDTNAGERINAIRSLVEDNVDTEAVLGIARSAPHMGRTGLPVMPDRKDITIAVARDAAFCFYYEDDLEALERAGAKLEFFSPLHDEQLPRNDAILLGGGFPETHIAALEANTAMKVALRKAILGGRPVHAECGGLMYLCRTVRFRNESGEMLGIIDADAVMQSRPQGRGLVVLEDPQTGHAFPAHEFHYARLENLPKDTRYRWKVRRGHGIDGLNDGIQVHNVTAGFSHFRDTSTHHWALDFVDLVRREQLATRQRMAGNA
ncbi:MAG: cobyrinate a,c-diamide synthase [Nitratireductor sp.]|nr:cobyrinate a,c-diamide synthase [Nitratireductor sp.]MCC0020951.1 cobyrinate a,c-diamide synthase [Nitratireductor sp.]